MTSTAQTPSPAPGLSILSDREIQAMLDSVKLTVPCPSPATGEAESGQAAPTIALDALRRHRTQSRFQAKTPSVLTAEECRAILGVRPAVKMNFVPMMLSSLARNEAKAICDYGRTHRLDEIKKHSRLLRTMLDEYERALHQAYGPAYPAFLRYLERFRNLAAGNVWLMRMHADTLSANQHPQRKHRAPAVHTLICIELIKYCEDYDTKVDRMLAEKLKRPVSRKPDSFLTTILKLCRSIQRDTGFDLKPDDTLKTWIGVLSNQAWRLVDDIITEEDEQHEQNLGNHEQTD